MHLAWIVVRDFRSYAEFEFRPEPGVNVLVGHNGAGKTNLLEAIGYLSMLRSFRRTPDPALIRTGAEQGIIRGGFSRASGEVKVEVEIPIAGRRRILFNGKRPTRHSQVAAEVPLVAFLPDDLDVVKRGPGLRREYIDDLVSRSSPAGAADLGEYEKAVRQRNALLREHGRDTDPLTLEAWDSRVGELGGRVLVHRLRMLDALMPAVAAAYRRVGGDAGVGWTYRSSWAGENAAEEARAVDASTSRLQDALASRRRRDLEQRTTSVGPHRDDVVWLIDGREARVQASQGEQRSVALSLRLAAFGLLRDLHDDAPLLLLDDVFSELDERRAAGVLELLPQGQVFVTTAREDDLLVKGRVWKVSEGSVL